MKVYHNNRNEKIQIVQSICFEEINSGDFAGNLQNAIVKVANYYVLMKESKSGRGVEKTVKGAKVLVDAYERALAAVNLYCYANNIPNTIGYVYVATSPTYSGYFKIGCSKDAEKRLSSYQTATPFRDFYLKKYTIVSDYRGCETLFLEHFKNHSVGNEWVKLTEEDLQSSFKEVSRLLWDKGQFTRFGVNMSNKDRIFSCLGR